MILESILKVKRKDETTLDANYIKEKNLLAINESEVFPLFKRFCYNAWKFKNFLYAADDFQFFHEDSKQNLDEAHDEVWDNLLSLKAEMYKNWDDIAEQVFKPLYCVVVYTIYQSIANKNLRLYRKIISSCEEKISDLLAEKSINTGKLEILEEMKSKILRSHALRSSMKNTFDSTEVSISKLKQLNAESVKLIKSLKDGKNKREADFFAFLNEFSELACTAVGNIK